MPIKVYPDSEILALVSTVSALTGLETRKILKEFCFNSSYFRGIIIGFFIGGQAMLTSKNSFLLTLIICVVPLNQPVFFMIVFIAINLMLSFIVETGNPLRTLLSSSFFIYIGLTGAVIGIIASILKKWSDRVIYDLFASSTLLLWFAYWQPIFKAESPIFFFFPLFFAIIASFFSLAFIGRRDKIDNETLRQMRILSEKEGLQSWVIMLCVLGSLELQEHFQVFPVMMTMLLVRFTLSRCIEKR